MIFYLADLHLWHDNVLRYDARPFADTDEMAACIRENWNAAVTAKDTVYVLGDYTWNPQKGAEFLRHLNGKIHLIRGNHDKLNAALREQFCSVQDYLELRDGERRVVLSHYPIAHWNGQFHGAVHLYGHVHGNPDGQLFLQYGQQCRAAGIPFAAYNAGCMLPYMNYTPRTLDEITAANA